MANNFAISCILFLLISTILHHGYSQKIKGMAFSTGHDLDGYRKPSADQSMNNLKKTCTNYVHISAYSKMTGIHAKSAYPLTDDNSIRYIIRKSKAKGLKVFFKPAIEPEGTWRGFIPGTPFWFNSVYLPFIKRMATIAQQEGVDLFAVGSEYRATIENRFAWAKIIAEVRKIYFGKITYVGNHDAYTKVSFWDLVDYISISGYFKHLPGTRGFSPNMAQTKTMWAKIADEVNNWRLRSGFGNKQVVIAEIGVQSKGDGVVYRVPWDWKVVSPVNFFEQMKMYEGLLSAFLPKSWIKGVILWNWELDPNAGKTWPYMGGYTPQNKPALQTLTNHFCQY